MSAAGSPLGPAFDLSAQDAAWEQVKAFDAVLMALDFVALAGGTHGQQLQARCRKAATRWQAATAGEVAGDAAFVEADLAAQVAAVIALRAPSAKLADLARAARACALAAPVRPLRPIPAHIQRRDAAISGE